MKSKGEIWARNQIFITLAAKVAEAKAKRENVLPYGRVAVHEAAHACCADMLSRVVHVASIKPDWESCDERGRGTIGHIIHSSIEHAAEFTPEALDKSLENVTSDNRTVASLCMLRVVDGTPGPQWKRILREVREQRAAVVKIVDILWPEIVKLAELLLEKGTLSREEIAEVLHNRDKAA